MIESARCARILVYFAPPVHTGTEATMPPKSDADPIVDLERRVAMLEKKLKALDNKVGAAEIQAAQKEAARAMSGKPGTNVLTRRSRK